MERVAGGMAGIEAAHFDLSADLTLADRLARLCLSVSLAPQSGRLANLDLRRWRQELNVGMLAARRLAKAEADRPFDVLHFYTQPAAYASLARMKRGPAIVCLDCTQRLASLEAESALS